MDKSLGTDERNYKARNAGINSYVSWDYLKGISNWQCFSFFDIENKCIA